MSELWSGEEREYEMGGGEGRGTANLRTLMEYQGVEFAIQHGTSVEVVFRVFSWLEHLEMGPLCN